MNFAEKRLYHQIHPLKLATDIAVTPISLFFLWRHEVLPAILIGFAPPILMSAVTMKRTTDLEKIKNSVLGQYVKHYMTPMIEVIRLLTLVPMAYGAWVHQFGYIVLGLLVLILAWCNGLIWRRRGRADASTRFETPSEGKSH